jgi:hypothetical protein
LSELVLLVDVLHAVRLIDDVHEVPGLRHAPEDAADPGQQLPPGTDVPVGRLPDVEVGSLVVPGVDAEVFDLVYRGPAEPLLDLTLIEASPSGPITLPLNGVRLRAGASLRVEPWDWARLHEMPVILRTTLSDGSQLLEAGNATAMSLWALLQAMIDSGDLPNRGIAVSIQKQAENARLGALENHLRSLVADGVISTATAQVLLAVAKAMPES